MNELSKITTAEFRRILVSRNASFLEVIFTGAEIEEIGRAIMATFNDHSEKLNEKHQYTTEKGKFIKVTDISENENLIRSYMTYESYISDHLSEIFKFVIRDGYETHLSKDTVNRLVSIALISQLPPGRSII